MNKYFSHIWLLFYFLLFFLISIFTPLMADDFVYYKMASTDISGLIGLLTEHYFNWGGRVLAHFFDGLVLRTQSSLFFALINTFILFLSIQFSYVLLSSGIQINGEKKSLFHIPIKDPLFLFISFGFSIFAKNHLQTMFWKTGSANYLWMFSFLIWFLYSFKAWILEGEYLNLNYKKTETYLFLASALLVGATNENVGVGLLGLMAWHVLKRFFGKKKLLSYDEILVGSLIIVSTLFLILAPGNQVRSLVADPEGLPSVYGRLNWWVESLLIFLFRPDGIIFIGFSLYLFFINRTAKQNIFETIKKSEMTQSLFVLFLLMTLAYLGHNGNFYGRKSFNLGYVFVLAMLSLSMTVGLQTMLERKKHIVILTLFLIIPILRWGYDLEKVYQFRTAILNREAKMRIEKENGNLNQQVPILENPYDLEDLSTDSTRWTNSSYANFLDLKSITGIIVK